MPDKKILILYTSIGLGHKSIAENIGFYLQRAGYEVSLFDAHKVQDSSLINSGGKLYPWLLKNFPFVWDWLYDTKWFISCALPFRTKIAAFNYDKILNKINEIKPDLVISAHNTSSAVISYLKSRGLYTGKFGIAFSDFHLHRFWLFNNADFYLANIEEQKKEMVALGMPAEKIYVCGMTLSPSSQAAKQSSGQVRAQLQIPDGNKVVLVSSGSQGIGLDDKVINQLLKLDRVSIVIACGKNHGVADYYRQKFGSRLIVLEFYSPMEQLYAIADVFITKPGGLSIAEALSWHLPMVIFYALPGGEKYNYKYLVQNDLVMAKPKDIALAVSQELSNGFFRKALAANPHLTEILDDPSLMLDAVRQQLS